MIRTVTIALVVVLLVSDVMAAPPCDVVAARMLAQGGDSDWSQVDDLIAYDQTDQAGVYQLRTIRPDGADDVCISCGAAVGGPDADRHKIAPVWQPGGQFLVLQGEMHQHPLSWLRNNLVAELNANGLWMNLYATTPDGSRWWALTNYAHDQTDGAMAPHFSADGAHLLWSRLVKAAGDSDPWGQWRLMIADFVTDRAGVPSLQNVQDITPGGAGQFFESHGFSPDGSSVIFTSDRDAPNRWVMNIWSMNLSTGALTELTGGQHWNEHASYSPDGQTIAYMSSQPYDLVSWLIWGQSGAELFLMDAAGSQPRQLTHFNVPNAPESDTSHISLPARPNWSPDGTRLAVTRQLGGRDYPRRELWMLNLDAPCGALAAVTEPR